MVNIRPYKPHDRAALETCLVELQQYERTLSPYLLPATDDVIKPYTDELLRNCERQRGMIYLAEAGDVVAGFVAVYVYQDEDILSSLREYPYVSDIVVMPAYRGQGVGQALLAHAEAHARQLGYRELAIQVLANNQTALKSYHRFGFEDVLVTLLKRLDVPTDSV
jgi:ribosomal protein S18 acetylase RimI-like enzyme